MEIRTAIRGEERTVPADPSLKANTALTTSPRPRALRQLPQRGVSRCRDGYWRPSSAPICSPGDPSCSSDSRRMGVGPIEMRGSEPKWSRSPDKFSRRLTGHDWGILNFIVRRGFQTTQPRYPGRLSSQLQVPLRSERQETMRAPTSQCSISA